MLKGLIVGAVAGLVSVAGGQGVTLHFNADRSVAQPGETVHWVVSASFTGYADSTAYFGRFSGDFVASDPSLGMVTGYTNLMGALGDPPALGGASIEGVSIYSSVLWGTNDPANPIDIFEFDVVAGTNAGTLEYDAVGECQIFPDDGLFTPPDLHSGFTVESGSVRVEPGSVTFSLVADRASVAVGETVGWTVRASFEGLGEPTAFIGGVLGDLIASDPLIGAVNGRENLLPSGSLGTVSGASLVGLELLQIPGVDPIDTSNPIEVCRFEVAGFSAGSLSYGFSGVARLFPDDTSDGWLTDAVVVRSDMVEIHEPCVVADLADPFGTLDLDDVSSFVASILEGCPSVGTELVLVEAYREYSREWIDPSPPFEYHSESVSSSDVGSWRDTTITDVGAWGSVSAYSYTWEGESESFRLVFDVPETVHMSLDASGWSWNDAGCSLRLTRNEPSSETVFLYTAPTDFGLSGGIRLEPGRYSLLAGASSFINPGEHGASVSFSLVVDPCPTAGDLDGSGLLDLADVVAFVEAFVAGCP